MQCDDFRHKIRTDDRHWPSSWYSHLDDCPDCLDYMIDELVGEFPATPIPPHFAEHISSMLGAQPKTRRFTEAAFLGACVMASAILCLLLSLPSNQAGQLLLRPMVLASAVFLEISLVAMFINRSTLV